MGGGMTCDEKSDGKKKESQWEIRWGGRRRGFGTRRVGLNRGLFFDIYE